MWAEEREALAEYDREALLAVVELYMGEHPQE